MIEMEKKTFPRNAAEPPLKNPEGSKHHFSPVPNRKSLYDDAQIPVISLSYQLVFAHTSLRIQNDCYYITAQFVLIPLLFLSFFHLSPLLQYISLISSILLSSNFCNHYSNHCVHRNPMPHTVSIYSVSVICFILFLMLLIWTLIVLSAPK